MTRRVPVAPKPGRQAGRMPRRRPAGGIRQLRELSRSNSARRMRLLLQYNEPMSGNDFMKPASPGVKLTYDDFRHFPDDGRRHELIDGEHYVTASPNRKHQAIVTNLCRML